MSAFTPEQEARLREIVREEIDADDAWHRGPLEAGETMSARADRRRVERLAAIAAGRREAPRDE